MPYINRERREAIKDNPEPNNPGELNYLLTKAVHYYCERKGLNYVTINDIIGALEGAKLEFYRRVAVPYENSKLAENGDVYERKTRD